MRYRKETAGQRFWGRVFPRKIEPLAAWVRAETHWKNSEGRCNCLAARFVPLAPTLPGDLGESVSPFIQLFNHVIILFSPILNHRYISVALEILSIIAIPIINNTDINTIIPSKILNVPPTLLITFTIFWSANGSLIAAAKLYKILSIASFIIGATHIPIIIITPTIPTAFFINDVAPKYCIY